LAHRSARRLISAGLLVEQSPAETARGSHQLVHPVGLTVRLTLSGGPAPRQIRKGMTVSPGHPCRPQSMRLPLRSRASRPGRSRRSKLSTKTSRQLQHIWGERWDSNPRHPGPQLSPHGINPAGHISFRRSHRRTSRSSEPLTLPDRTCRGLAAPILIPRSPSARLERRRALPSAREPTAEAPVTLGAGPPMAGRKRGD
jgi:hypothetical protein